MPRSGLPRSGPGAAAFERNYAPLPGSEVDPLAGAYVVSRANPSRFIQVTVLLRPAPRAAEQRVAAAEDFAKLLPKQRQYLTREKVALQQGANPADVQEVAQFARHHGLQVKGSNLAARTVHLAGTTADLSRAFGTRLAVYRYRRLQVSTLHTAAAEGFYRGRTGPIQIPEPLLNVVEGVFGLDNRPAARPHFRRRVELGGFWARAQNRSYSPAEVARLYNFPLNVDGRGECIAIIELGGGFVRRDLNQYFTRLGIPVPRVKAISVLGAQNRPTGNPNGPDGEVMLDIEVAGAVAPGATIAVYFAPNTTQGFLRAINRAIHDRVNRPSVISISWGNPESRWSQQAMRAFDQAFQVASLMGVTVCAAAGDGGSNDGVSGRVAHVDFPASSPFVLACGGTRLDSSNGSIAAESVWNNGPGGGAAGGGISDFFGPPPWQAGAGVPPSVNRGGRVGRGLPDLSGDADPNTGYQVRVDGVDGVIGGTSAVSPLLSGLTALLNQSLGARVGYLNPLLYTTLASTGAIRDITTGNNDMTGFIGGYAAGPQWDAASGFGVPDGGALLAALISSDRQTTAPPTPQAADTSYRAQPAPTTVEPAASPAGNQDERATAETKRGGSKR